jgi:hypothetical protein
VGSSRLISATQDSARLFIDQEYLLGMKRPVRQAVEILDQPDGKRKVTLSVISFGGLFRETTSCTLNP